MKEFKRETELMIIGGVLLFAFAFSIGNYTAERHLRSYFQGFEPIRKPNSTYSYISPLIGVDSSENTKVLYNDTESTVEDFIARKIKKGLVDDAAVYYRNFTTSTWLGVNESKEFVPASLLKILIAIAAYKEGEISAGFLDRRILYTQSMYDMALARDGKVDTKLTVGSWYTARELVDHMLRYSDNTARDILSSSIDERYVMELYSLIGIKSPDLNKEYRISAEDYSLFLRVLYNSKYLNEKNSEQVLSILAQSTFTQGLVSGLPSKVGAAHKFGVHTFLSPEGEIENEVHDCGIVYEPQTPYLVCIMTKGQNQEELISVISELSRIIYDDHLRHGF